MDDIFAHLADDDPRRFHAYRAGVRFAAVVQDALDQDRTDYFDTLDKELRHMDALTALYTADCRLVIERQNGACFLRVSRPGAALTSAAGDAYTLHIYAPTLEEALTKAVAQMTGGATYAVEQAERHPGGD